MKLESKLNKQNKEENLLLKKRTLYLKTNLEEVMPVVLLSQVNPLLLKAHKVLVFNLKMLWLPKEVMEELFQLFQIKITKVVNQDLLMVVKKIGRIQNILKSKDKLSSNSKKNKKNLKVPSQRKRRRSPRKRRSQDPQVEIFSMVKSMMGQQSTNNLNSVLLQNLMPKKWIVTITKNKKWAMTNMINPITTISIINLMLG